MHQSTTPYLSQTIWARGASRHFLSLPIVQTLLPVTFQAVIMRQLRRWKGLWRRSLTCSQKRTSMGPCRSCWNGTTRSCQLEGLLRKGLEFHVCTINKSAYTKKSLETYRMHLVYICIKYYTLNTINTFSDTLLRSHMD